MLLAITRTIVRDEFQTFIAGEILQAAEPSPVAASSDIIEWVRRLLDLTMSVHVALCPTTLVTPFGRSIGGEYYDGVILISSLCAEHPVSLPRLLTHEIGHYLGLSEHLDCVMSPYYIEDTTFCTSWVHALAKQGNRWGSIGRQSCLMT
jgi:hypothetical protein